MKLAIILFVIGIFGLIRSRKNLLLMIMSVEIILLAVTLQILFYSLTLDDVVAQIFGLYLIALGGGESAIGLGILVAFYRLRGSITIV